MHKLKMMLLQAGICGMNGIYFLIKLLPVRNKVTMISKHRNGVPTLDFALLKQEIETQYPDTEIVILTKKIENRFLYGLHMFRQLYHIATSQVVLIDSYTIAISAFRQKSGLQVIQLWHAMGNMKRFGYAIIGEPDGNDPDVARILRMHQGYDRVLISSKSFLDDYIAGFHVDPEIVEEIPLPKADLLTDATYRSEKKAELLSQYPALQGKRVILYCPTFRLSSDTAEKACVQKLIDAVDHQKYALIYKPHPLSKLSITDPRVIIASEDAFDLFFVSDYVISDYSTIIYEAGLADLPVFLYAYDWERFQGKRSFNIDLANDVPTLFTDDPKIILHAIEQDDFNRDAFQAFVKENVVMPQRGTCCEAIVALMRIGK